MSEYLFGSIVSTSDAVVSAKKDTMLITERNKKIDEVRRNYDNIEKEMGVIADTFVKKDNEKFGEMFMELEQIAKRYQITLTKEPSLRTEERMGDTISAAFFNIDASGEYDNLMKFMLYLDNFKYYVDLNNVEIATGAKEDDKDISTTAMKAELEVYLDDK